MRAVKRLASAVVYAAAVGQFIVGEAMMHGALAQAVSVAGGIDPQTGISTALPWFQGLCASAVVGTAGSKGVSAAMDHRSFMPHALGGCGGTLLIYGGPAVMRHFGVPI